MDKFSKYKKKIEGEIEDYGLDELKQVSDTVKQFDRERNQLIADLRSSTESMENVKRRLYVSLPNFHFSIRLFWRRKNTKCNTSCP